MKSVTIKEKLGSLTFYFFSFCPLCIRNRTKIYLCTSRSRPSSSKEKKTARELLIDKGGGGDDDRDNSADVYTKIR